MVTPCIDLWDSWVSDLARDAIALKAPTTTDEAIQDIHNYAQSDTKNWSGLVNHCQTTWKPQIEEMLTETKEAQISELISDIETGVVTKISLRTQQQEFLGLPPELRVITPQNVEALRGEL